MKQVLFFLLVMICFTLPSKAEATSTLLVEGKMSAQTGLHATYLKHVDLSIVHTSDDAALSSSPTVHEDDERTIFQNFHLPHYEQKWHVHQFAYKNAAWHYEPLKTVKISMIDTGVSFEMLIDPRFKHGKNFVNTQQQPLDDNGHGTALASITFDVIGPYPVEIIPIKAADSTGSFTISNIVKAIDYAMEQQVDIINLSFGAKTPHDAEQQAIEKAIEAGIVVFSSTGNTGRHEYYYPAAYPNVISVGAIDNKLKRASFSTYNDAIDFVAPGADLYVQRHDEPNAYTTIDGTSFATAYLAGQYAILKANTLSVAAAELAALATDLGRTGFDHEYGHGMLETDKALAIRRGKAWQTLTTTEPQKTWTIRLSKAVESKQALAQHLHILDAALIEQAVTIDVISDSVIEVTPVAALPQGEYWLVIDAQLQAKSGQPLKQPAVVKFIVQ